MLEQRSDQSGLKKGRDARHDPQTDADSDSAQQQEEDDPDDAPRDSTRALASEQPVPSSTAGREKQQKRQWIEHPSRCMLQKRDEG
jgi:hypothetical protein